jgi:ATP-binding cassette, subfamily C (CFTR/MRP), member 1
LNASQRPAYLLAMIQAWLQTNLTMLVGVIAICLTTLATQLRTSSSFTGASLLKLMNLASTITAMMQSYTELETSIGAINRLRTFSQKVKPEDGNDENIPVPEEWPANGSVLLNAVSAPYRYGCSTLTLATTS